MTKKLRTLLALLAALALIAAACSDDDGSAGPEVSTDVEDLTENDGLDDGDGLIDEDLDDPEELGEEVTVSGDISRIDDGTAFEIAGPDGPLLILYGEGLPEDVDEGSLVQVTGTVREVLVDTFEMDFGYVYDPIYDRYLERNAVAASEVVVLEADNNAAEATGPLAVAAELDDLNDSDVDGDVAVVLEDNQMQVTLSAEDTTANLPHAMHVHFDPGIPSSCPDDDGDLDVDGDDILTTAEGLPAYGPVQIALTVDGDASADSGLALDRFPVADADGRVEYMRTIEMEDSMLPMLVGEMTVAVVIHGDDFDASGAYDGDRESSLDPSVPLEATVPVACGVVTLK